MDAGGVFIALWIALPEGADLRAGEALHGHGAAALADRFGAAGGCGDFRAFLRSGDVHPDRRGGAGEYPVELLQQGACGIKRGEALGETLLEIHAAVLLAGAGDGDHAAERPTRVLHALHQQFQSGHPQLRIGVDLAFRQIFQETAW